MTRHIQKSKCKHLFGSPFYRLYTRLINALAAHYSRNSDFQSIKTSACDGINWKSIICKYIWCDVIGCEVLRFFYVRLLATAATRTTSAKAHSKWNEKITQFFSCRHCCCHLINATCVCAHVRPHELHSYLLQMYDLYRYKMDVASAVL